MKRFYMFLMSLVAIVAMTLPTGAQAQANAITAFPWSCDFEDSTQWSDWTISNGANGWFIGSATNNGGTYAMYVSNDNGATSSYSGSACVSYAYVTIDVANPGQYAMAFDWKCNGESTYDFLRVAIAPSATTLPTSYTDWTSTDVPSSWTAIDGGNKLNLQSGWQNYTTAFSIPAAGSYKIVFVWRNDGSVYNMPPAAIDNVAINELTCPQPLNLVVQPSAEQIDLSWTPGGTETEWMVVISDTLVAYTTDTFYTALDLTPQTLYHIAVYAICGADDTSFATVENVRTPCLPLDSLPYFQNFDGLTTSTSAATGVQAPCWDAILTGTATYTTGSYVPQVYYSSSYAYSGSYSYRLYGNGYHMLPPMPVPLDSVRLSFADYTTSASYGLEVGVMEGNTFVPIQVISTPASTHAEYVIYFGNYTGNSRVIAFHNYYTTSTTTYYSYHYLDNIKVDYIPACPLIMSHRVTSTASAARISLDYETAMGFAPDGYQISYGYASDSLASATTVTTTEPVFTLTGLDADTAYTVSVITTCPDGNSTPYVFNFNTQKLPCLEWDGTPRDSIIVGTPGTGTTYYMPVNTQYGYSYVNHLITADELPINSPTTFTGIGFQYASTVPMTNTVNCTIYLAYTNMTTTCDHFVPYADLQLVYIGPLNCTQGWNYFEFNQGSFAYDGVSNIVVAVVNNSGVIEGTDHMFNYQANSHSRRVQGSNPYGPAEIDAASSSGGSTFRSNMKLLTGSGTCVATASCYAPAVTVCQDSAGNVQVDWIPGYQETAWDLDYKAGDTASWVNVLTATTLNSYTFNLSDLLTNTQYTFRVTPSCNDTVLAGTARFKTPCGLYSVPFTEDFENFPTSASNPLPDCWIKHTTYSTNYPSGSTSQHHSGSVSVYMYSSNSSYSYMVLPQFNIPIDSTTVGFWLFKGNTSYVHALNVGVMVDPDDVSTFTSVATVSPSTINTWEPFEVSLRSYTGTGRYIAIMSPNGVYSYPYLDDLVVNRITECPRVDNVNVVNISQTEATVTWDTTIADGYVIEYGPAGFAFGTGTSLTSFDDSVNITGLTPNTPYDVYVAGLCGADSSAWSFNASFRTACAMMTTLPFTENFENQITGSSSTSSSFIPCWGHLNNGSSYGGYPYVGSSSTYNHTTGGNKGLYWYNTTTTGSYGDYMYAILPQIDTTVISLNTLQLRFWAKASSATYNPVFQVGVMNNATDTNMEVLGIVNVDNGTQWSEYTVGLNGHVGTGSFVAIRALRPTSSWTAYIDDVTLEHLPPCPYVEDLTMSNVLLTTATVSWTDTSSNSSWYIEYDDVPFTPGTGHMTPIVVTDTFYNFTGLDSGTVYYVYVYPYCDTNILPRDINFTTLAAAPATLPYNCTFEDAGVNGWDLINGSQTNKWYVGNAVNNGGSRALYISDDNGVSNTYTISATSNVFATRAILLDSAGDYAISYDWRVQGESCCDYLRVFLAPIAADLTAGNTSGIGSTGAPAGWIALDGGNKLNQQSTWTNYTEVFTLPTPNTYKLVFFWHNDGSIGTDPSGAIDNVQLVRMSCPMPHDITATNITDVSATLQWQAGGSESQWEVTVNGVTSVVSTPSINVTGLSAFTSYTVVVRGLCGAGDTSLAVIDRFTTEMCNSPISAYSFDTTDNATTSTYSPIGYSFYNYGYVQTIIDSAKMAALSGAEVTAFGFNPTVTTAGNMYENMTVYMANIPESTFTSDFIHPDANHVFVQVIDNHSFSYTTTGWQYHAFDNTFTWDGHSNVLVSVKRDNGDYVSGATFAAHSLSGNKMIYDYNDDDPYNINTATGGTTSSAVGDIILISCGAGCPSPVVSTVTYDYGSATITVTGNDLGYELTYGTDPSDLGNPMTNTTGVFNLTGLTPATQYFFAVTQLCDSGAVSNPTSGVFTTDSLPCFDPTDLALVGTTFNSAQIGWTSMGNATSWIVSVTGAGETRYDTVTTNPYTIAGLYANQQYTVMVMSVCGNGAIESGWSEPITFTTDVCAKVTGVAVNDITGTTATVSWNPVTGSMGYKVFYGDPDFYDNEALTAEVAAGSTSYTITGLMPQTSYEVYVRNRCTETLYSDVTNADRVGFTTAAGNGIYDVETGTLTLYPNPASEKVTLTVTGFDGAVEVEIVDMNGRVNGKWSVANGQLTIDVSEFAQGAYFVRVTGEHQTAVRKLIVK